MPTTRAIYDPLEIVRDIPYFGRNADVGAFSLLWFSRSAPRAMRVSSRPLVALG
jgi:hypothetical protein